MYDLLIPGAEAVRSTIRRECPTWRIIRLHALLSFPSPYAAIESVIPWRDSTQSITEADKLAAHLDELMQLAASLKKGPVTASLMLRNLSSYPRQNGMAIALGELGRIERSLFILDWLQNVDFHRRVHARLNKGEARNSLARAVFFNRLGEFRDRSYEQQRHRASRLNLLTAAIVLWNTVYLERAVQALRKAGPSNDPTLLTFLSPLSWKHINLTGDNVWQDSKPSSHGLYRPLRD